MTMKKHDTLSFMRSLPILAGVLGRKLGVKIQIGGSPRTDGKTIYLPPLPIDGGEELFTLANGFLDHEAAHVRDTDFDKLNEADLSPLALHLFNLVEDVRVERELVKIYPGCREHFRKLYTTIVEKVPPVNPSMVAQNITTWLINAVFQKQYPEIAFLEEEFREAVDPLFPNLISQLENFVQRGLSCNSTSDCIAWGKDVEDFLFQYFSRSKSKPAAKGQESPAGEPQAGIGGKPGQQDGSESSADSESTAHEVRPDTQDIAQSGSSADAPVSPGSESAMDSGADDGEQQQEQTEQCDSGGSEAQPQDNGSDFMQAGGPEDGIRPGPGGETSEAEADVPLPSPDAPGPDSVGGDDIPDANMPSEAFHGSGEDGASAPAEMPEPEVQPDDQPGGGPSDSGDGPLRGDDEDASGEQPEGDPSAGASSGAETEPAEDDGTQESSGVGQPEPRAEYEQPVDEQPIQDGSGNGADPERDDSDPSEPDADSGENGSDSGIELEAVEGDAGSDSAQPAGEDSSPPIPEDVTLDPSDDMSAIEMLQKVIQGDDLSELEVDLREALGSLVNSESELPQSFGELLKQILEQASADSWGKDCLHVAEVREERHNEMPRALIEDAQSATKVLATRLSGLLQTQTLSRTHTGRRGRVDGNRLHRLAVSNPRVFKTSVEEHSINTAVHILLDCSGSMIECMSLANAACYSVASALHRIRGVNVGVTAFPGEWDYEDPFTVSPILRHGQRMHTRFSVQAHGCTPMGEALWWTCQQMMALKEDRKIILVITDGYPDSFRNTEAALDAARKMGFEIIGIGIGEHGAFILNLIENSRVINEIQELAPAMFGVLQQALTEKG